MRHVAKRVQHRHHCHHRQNKGQYITEAQVVIDVAEQHQHQHEDQRESLSGGNDEDAALRECERADFYFRAKQPGAKFLFECGEHSLGYGDRFDQFTYQCLVIRLGVFTDRLQAVAGHAGQHRLHIFRYDGVAVIQQCPGARGS